MAVSKRIRFEILRRDGFRCAYCGATPGETELHVDHVIPVALGGTDIPENLVAACEPCNTGKASTSPDEVMIAQVNHAVALAEAARVQLGERLVAQVDEIHNYEDAVWLAWEHFAPSYKANSPIFDLSNILHWYSRGIPIEAIEHAMRVTLDARHVPWHGKGGYMVGVIRNMVAGAERGD